MTFKKVGQLMFEGCCWEPHIDIVLAADAEEETGGKWRAGDKAKSCRAFLRAIEIYSLGLQRYPRNFDLAYNK